MTDHPLTVLTTVALGESPGVVEKPSNLAVLLLAFGVMLAIFLLLRHQWRRSSRHGPKAGARLTPAERIDAIRSEANATGPLHSTMAEATELAQRLAAQLDNKAERLEQLIVEAEAIIQRLEARDGARPGSARADAQASPESRPLADEGDVDPATRRIYELADEGHDPVEIARRLDQHLGKVQLILALRRA
jgi:hypothetical protein